MTGGRATSQQSKIGRWQSCRARCVLVKDQEDRAAHKRACPPLSGLLETLVRILVARRRRRRQYSAEEGKIGDGRLTVQRAREKAEDRIRLSEEHSVDFEGWDLVEGVARVP